MKIKFLLAAAWLAALTATNAFAAEDVLLIGATSVPHAQILQQVKPLLKKEGVDLQIKEFSDYVQPNLLVEQNQLDANFFQHRPYLEQFNKEHGTHLVELTAVHIEPMGVYVGNNPKLKNFKQDKQVAKLPKGLIAGIPSDTTNEGRALLLLQEKGFIKIKSGVKYPTKKDIVANPYEIIFKELDAAMLPRALQANQLAIAVMNSNFALQAKINPLKDSIFLEDAKSPYVNIVAVKSGNENQPKMKKLAAALHDKLVTQYIINTYKGAVVPVK